jgi:predicted DCC family thiol-disulfide oxidoreductase YuxK
VSAPATGRYVVLYDGDCRFCTRWKERMEPRDRDGRIEWLSIHDPSVAGRFPGLDREDALRQMYVFAPDGAVHKGADGWMALFGVLRGLRFLPWLGGVPGARAVMRRVYRAIAERRYRLSCSGAACRRPGRGADRVLVVLGLGALSSLAALTACSGAPPDPAAERLKMVADPEAESVVMAMFEAYGGYESFAGRRNVQYTYRMEFYGGQPAPQKVTRQIHRLALGGSPRAYVEDLDGPERQVVRLDGDSVQVIRNGALLSDPADIDLPRAFTQFARWSFLLPWNLVDPDSDLEYRGVHTPPSAGPVPAEECDVVRLRLGGGPEEASQDWYDFYVSRLSHLLERIHSYRTEDGAYRVTLWSDHRKFDGLRVAGRRETHASDVEGTVGPLEVVAEYSEVQFDAPFTDEIFRPAKPLAASASRE